MIKTLVIDDEPLALQQLAAYVRKIPFLDLVAECQSAIEARDIINNDNNAANELESYFDAL